MPALRRNGTGALGAAAQALLFRPFRDSSPHGRRLASRMQRLFDAVQIGRPTAEACNQVMSGGATDVWRPKPGRHPALPMMDPYIGDARSFLDIGASNGDLLAQLYEKADRVSAMDVVEYPQCREIVMRNGEYIIGQLEGQLSWSGAPMTS